MSSRLPIRAVQPTIQRVIGLQKRKFDMHFQHRMISRLASGAVK